MALCFIFRANTFGLLAGWFEPSRYNFKVGIYCSQ